MLLEIANRLQLARVEFLIEIGLTILGDSIETTIDFLQETVLGELLATRARMLTNGAAECLYCGGCQIPVFPDEFENTVIRWCHPLGGFPHFVTYCFARWHMNTGTPLFETIIN